MGVGTWRLRAGVARPAARTGRTASSTYARRYSSWLCTLGDEQRRQTPPQTMDLDPGDQAAYCRCARTKPAEDNPRLQNVRRNAGQSLSPSSVGWHRESHQDGAVLNGNRIYQSFRGSARKKEEGKVYFSAASGQSRPKAAAVRLVHASFAQHDAVWLAEQVKTTRYPVLREDGCVPQRSCPLFFRTL